MFNILPTFSGMFEDVGTVNMSRIQTYILRDKGQVQQYFQGDVPSYGKG